MRAAFRALLADILDYAGLFPPAKLDLDEAIRNYARYRRGPNSWMLARFVCPAARLAELAPYVDELFDRDMRLRLSILGRGGTTSVQFLAGLQSDLQDVAAFGEATGYPATVETFEVRVPPEASCKDGTTQLVDAAVESWQGQVPGGRAQAFFEPSIESDRMTSWSRIINSVARHNGRSCGGGSQEGSRGRAGVKLRCGGADATAFPSVEELASAIRSAASAGVPIKFTAGLHQPLRHRDAGLEADVNGFLSVFLAGCVAAVGEIDERGVHDILAAEAASAITLGDDFVSVRKTRVSHDAIVCARRDLVTSFGSCSFDEPLDGLRELGLIPREEAD